MISFIAYLLCPSRCAIYIIIISSFISPISKTCRKHKDVLRNFNSPVISQTLRVSIICRFQWLSQFQTSIICPRNQVLSFWKWWGKVRELYQDLMGAETHSLCPQDSNVPKYSPCLLSRMIALVNCCLLRVIWNILQVNSAGKLRITSITGPVNSPWRYDISEIWTTYLRLLLPLRNGRETFVRPYYALHLSLSRAQVSKFYVSLHFI